MAALTIIERMGVLPDINNPNEKPRVQVIDPIQSQLPLPATPYQDLIEPNDALDHLEQAGGDHHSALLKTFQQRCVEVNNVELTFVNFRERYDLELQMYTIRQKRPVLAV